MENRFRNLGKKGAASFQIMLMIDNHYPHYIKIICLLNIKFTIKIYKIGIIN